MYVQYITVYVALRHRPYVISHSRLSSLKHKIVARDDHFWSRTMVTAEDPIQKWMDTYSREILEENVNSLSINMLLEIRNSRI
jgi:hypothetical protein